MKAKKNYVKGMNLKAPKAGRPDFIRFELGINLADFRQYLAEQIANGIIEDRDGWINIDVCDPWQDGDSYNITLNTWKPEPQTNGATPPMPKFEDEGGLGAI